MNTNTNTKHLIKTTKLGTTLATPIQDREVSYVAK